MTCSVIYLLLLLRIYFIIVIYQFIGGNKKQNDDETMTGGLFNIGKSKFFYRPSSSSRQCLKFNFRFTPPTSVFLSLYEIVIMPLKPVIEMVKYVNINWTSRFNLELIITYTLLFSVCVLEKLSPQRTLGPTLIGKLSRLCQKKIKYITGTLNFVGQEYYAIHRFV